ncbi:hypothetical protein SAMN05892883_0273 [Jatrophihabitans sp. GAS493]|uniref:glycosyltransferase family 2 protein n=1 Tax=Jatrophihabitans sp. GAS493 TaxID=1907575 RepID=UPI000BBF538C|nr:hypothetical protein SAMN05892883_0273 [Jatrophihabitans sp. GAS493]
MVIVTWNGAHLLAECLDSVLDCGAKILVVDNASIDSTTDLLASDYPQVQSVRLPTNTGFAGGVAHALTLISTPYVVLLNNDAAVRPGWLPALLAPLYAEPRVAATSSKLLLPDGRMNSAGGLVTAAGYAHDRAFGQPDDGRWDEPVELMYGCGAALALRVEAVRAVGGIDPRFFMYYEDVDLSWRLHLAGWSVRYVPRAVVVHQHSATAGSGSLLHTFYTERNRLATLVRCGSAGMAVRAIARYPLTTLSVGLFESRPKAARRVRAYLSFLRWLPALLAQRRRLGGRSARLEVQRRLLERA